MTGRDSSGELIPDAQAFPMGVNDLSDFVHAQKMKFGWYTDRGKYTCSCANQKNYNSTLLCRPGSLGHEKQDATTYAKWGVDYVKSDSCFAPKGGDAPAGDAAPAAEKPAEAPAAEAPAAEAPAAEAPAAEAPAEDSKETPAE